jgi:hypothetical protein
MRLTVAVSKNTGELTLGTSVPDLMSDLKVISSQMVKYAIIHREICAWLDLSPQKWRNPPAEVAIGDSVPVE